MIVFLIFFYSSALIVSSEFISEFTSMMKSFVTFKLAKTTYGEGM